MPINDLRHYAALVLLSFLFNKLPANVAAITKSNQFNDINATSFTARGIGRAVAHCISGHEMTKCFEQEVLNILEAAIQDNSTWHLSDILTIEKKIEANEQSARKNFESRQQRWRQMENSFSDELAQKFLQVAQTRSLRLQLPRQLTGISDTLDGITIFTPSASSASSASTKPALLTSFDEEGTVRVFNGLVDDKIEAISNSGSNKKKKKKKEKDKDKNKDKNKNKRKIWYLKGRKKKDKEKNGAMMGGMMMMAMVAQMFLGKVILIAGGAFIMAKIALVIAVLGSLKKGSSGSSGNTEHVIISGGGGHSHDSGWHRSMPYDYEKFEGISAEHTSLIHAPPVSIEQHPGGSHIGPPITTNEGGYYEAHGMPAFL